MKDRFTISRHTLRELSDKARSKLDLSPIETVSDDEAETADYIVCLRLAAGLMMPDNRTGACAMCGHAIQFRPHAPKRPPKVCIDCATDGRIPSSP